MSSNKKNILDYEISTDSPQALIVASKNQAKYIENKLVKLGVRTKVTTKPRKEDVRYRYIFSFGKPDISAFLLREMLTTDGKYVYIDIGKDSLTEKDFRSFSNNLRKTQSREKFILVLRLGAAENFLGRKQADEVIEIVFNPISFYQRGIFTVDKRKPFDIRSDKVYEKKSQGRYNRIKNKEIFIKEREKIKQHHFEKADTGSKIRNHFKDLQVEDRLRYKKFNFKKTFFVTVIFLSAISATLLTSWYFYSVKNTFLSLKKGLVSSDLSSVSKDVKRAKSQISLAKGLYDSVTTAIFPLRSVSYVQDLGGLIYSAEDVISLTDDLFSSYRTFFNPKASAFGAYRNLKKEDLDNLRSKLDVLIGSLEHTSLKLESFDIPFFPKEEYGSYLKDWKNKLEDAHETSLLLDLVLFGEEDRLYLVLFQNNMELRPTGGFIGSFGILEAGNGQLKKFSIYDVYDADGQLKGHIDPPEPIRRYLSQPHFFLRDSNFDPDFTISAQTAAFFLEKELGMVADGVIGVNLYLIRDLLKVIGPVTLSDYDRDTISYQNFFFKMQLFSKRDFFPGSSEKRDFLNSLLGSLLSKIDLGDKLPWFELLAVLKNSLDEKNLLLYLKDRQSQAVIEDHGWAGRLVDVKCADVKIGPRETTVDNVSSSCAADYLMIVEANLGVNKANYFIEKEVDVKKTLTRDGSIQTEVVINYTNRAKTQDFSELTYVNYLRLFAPRQVTIRSVKVDGIRLDGSSVDFSSYQPDKSSIGFLVEVPFGKTSKVVVSFERLRVFTGEYSNYQFFLQRQGGDKPMPLRLSVYYPEKDSLKGVNFIPHKQTDSMITFTTDVSVDRLFVFTRS